jgi:hypothetical protein
VACRTSESRGEACGRAEEKNRTVMMDAVSVEKNTFCNIKIFDYGKQL